MKLNDIGYVNLKDLCEKVLGKDPRYVRTLSDQKKMPVVKNSKIHMVEACKAMIDYERFLARGQGSLNLTDERTRVAKINADTKELLYQRMKGELLEVKTLEKLLGRVLNYFKTSLLALKTTLTPDLQLCITAPEKEKVIEKGIYETLKQFSIPDFETIARMEGGFADNEKSEPSTNTKRKPLGRKKKSPIKKK